MNYLLFFIYLILLCWLLTKINFIQNTNLGNCTIVILFLLRVLAGVVNAWLNLYHFPISDSVNFHAEGIIEYHLMFSNPKEYLLDLFTANNQNYYGRIFDVTNSFWNNLRTNIIVKILSLFDIISNCNYFINSLFYNFLVFFGSISLYKIFIQVFPDKKNILLITLFLLPSFLYFTSGIHRDGLIFLAVSFVSLNMFLLLKKEGSVVKRISFILLNLLSIFLLRNFVLIAILPALVTWIVVQKRPKFTLIKFISSYILFALIFFLLKFITPKLDLPRYVSERQNAFMQLTNISSSVVNLNILYPTPESFLNNSVQALNHTLMRPYLSEHNNFFYIPASVEFFLYEVLFLLFLIFPVIKFRYADFIYYGIFFSLSMLLIIGYTIPILGALVRYRSIYLPFIITPMVCLTNINKIKSIIYYFIK